MKAILNTFAVALGLALSISTASASDSVESARSEITQAIEAMKASANVHDAERHVSYYAKDPSLLFVVNADKIVGWQALLDQQRKWWNDGKTNVKYTQVGETTFSMPAPGLVMTTYFLKSSSATPTGGSLEMRFGISALWQKRTEGWKIIYAHESVIPN